MLASEAAARIAEFSAEIAKQPAVACRIAARASGGRMRVVTCDVAEAQTSAAAADAEAAASHAVGQAVLKHAAAGRILLPPDEVLNPMLLEEDALALDELFATDEDYDCLT